jgi:hypothetical protein
MTKLMDDNLHDLQFHQKFSALVERYMMLTGFALENIVKAISICKFNSDSTRIASATRP